MLFRRRFLEGIRKGTVTLAFRRWRRPTVKEGGTLLTPVGELQIGSVSRVTPDSISAANAQQAGYPSREVLLAELSSRKEGDVYRIELGPLRPDPRTALRETPAAGEDLQELRDKLQQLDSRFRAAPWTRRVLEILDTHPEVPAGELCRLAGQEKMEFKRNVSKLKKLGLTESLGTGYRLSPRGAALLKQLNSEG